MPCRICKHKGHNARTHDRYMANKKKKVDDFIKKEDLRENDLLSFYMKSEPTKKEESCDCPICMEPIGDNNKFVTACGHTFCGTCILTNAQRNTKCPMCRQQIAPNVEIKSARTKFREIFVPRRMVEDIHHATSSILGDLEEALTHLAEAESNGEPMDLRTAMTRPILGGMLRYTQYIQSFVSDNI
tara:strand:+ start:8442 stop:8999 length:558 start_codon:yes stop_codon:yes gene_type:complete